MTGPEVISAKIEVLRTQEELVEMVSSHDRSGSAVSKPGNIIVVTQRGNEPFLLSLKYGPNSPHQMYFVLHERTEIPEQLRDSGSVMVGTNGTMYFLGTQLKVDPESEGAFHQLSAPLEGGTVSLIRNINPTDVELLDKHQIPELLERGTRSHDFYKWAFQVATRY